MAHFSAKPLQIILHMDRLDTQCYLSKLPYRYIQELTFRVEKVTEIGGQFHLFERYVTDSIQNKINIEK